MRNWLKITWVTIVWRWGGSERKQVVTSIASNPQDLSAEESTPPEWPQSQIDKKRYLVLTLNICLSRQGLRTGNFWTNLCMCKSGNVKILAGVSSNLSTIFFWTPGSGVFAKGVILAFLIPAFSGHQDSDHQSPEKGVQDRKTNKDTHCTHLQIGWSELTI